LYVALMTIRLVVFPGAFNWPLWVAQERGLFARYGVVVEVTEIPGSVVQWTALAEGRADLAITLMDNVVAYREGQGEAPVTVPDAIAVMASDARLMPALMVRPDIASYADLKGQTLSVDAVVTGLALILFALLEQGGLLKVDYEIVRTGGVLQRFEGLKRREFAGALFNAPFSSQLEELGFIRLDTAESVMARYQGHVVATRRGWAEKNRDALAGILRGLSDAIDWLYEPANRTDAFAIFGRAMPAAGGDSARVAYSVLFDAKSGFTKKGAVDIKGIAAVLDLRSRFGIPRKPMKAPEAYIDLRYLEAALKA
jgi:ABC-type nitrate/sulfonate/bicarbonate transport system substrate-binding protein